MSSVECIVMFISCSLLALILSYMQIFIGEPKGAIITPRIVKKLQVGENSILRKIIPFKKAFYNPTFGIIDKAFLLVNIISYLIVSFVFVNGVILLAIDKLIVEFLPDVIYLVLGLVCFGVSIINDIVLKILIVTI